MRKRDKAVQRKWVMVDIKTNTIFPFEKK